MIRKAAACAVIALLAAAGGAAAGPPGPLHPLPRQRQRFFTFDRDAAGGLPAGLDFGIVGRGPAVHWEVRRDARAPSAPNVLVQTGQTAGGDNLALALVAGLTAADAELTVRFMPLGGQEAQGAGFIYRYQDPENFYLVWANGKDETCLLTRVKKGKFKILDTQDAIVTGGVWHTLHLVFAKNTYAIYLDEELVMAGKDKGLLAPGRVGLCIRGDASASFDDFQVSD